MAGAPGELIDLPPPHPIGTAGVPAKLFVGANTCHKQRTRMTNGSERSTGRREGAEVRDTGTAGGTHGEARAATTLPPDPSALGRSLSQSEKVDEALLESMDASDPPAYGVPMCGAPGDDGRRSASTSWKRVDLSPRDFRTGRSDLLQSTFGDAFQAHGAPDDAAVFQSGRAYYFTPRGAEIMEDTLRRWDAEESEELTLPGSVWVAGGRRIKLMEH